MERATTSCPAVAVCAKAARIPRPSTAAGITAVIALIVLSGPVAVHAQSTGAMQGRVLDAAGSVLRGATVNVCNRSTAFDRTVLADVEGRYHVTAIPAGTYEVTVAAAGFKSAVIKALQFE